jgi:hypothetical protein
MRMGKFLLYSHGGTKADKELFIEMTTLSK